MPATTTKEGGGSGPALTFGRRSGGTKTTTLTRGGEGILSTY
jgi:hypothetical protein